MPAPSNRQEFPSPHPDWRGAVQVEPAPDKSLSKIARLWAPIRAILEKPSCTLARVSHRVVDRNTGIPYSADELETKILAQAGSISSADITDATFDPQSEDVLGKAVLYGGGGSLITTELRVISGSASGNVSALGLTAVRDYVFPDVNGTLPSLRPFADSTAANAVVSIGDAWWDTTLNKARVRLS